MANEIVLLSGGADSTVLLYDRLASRNPSSNDKIHVLSIMYGQRHRRELELAKKTVEKLRSDKTYSKVLGEHRIVDFNFGVFGGSPLTDTSLEVPDQESSEQTKTVVPYRNTAFITLAAMYAHQMGAEIINISAVYEDLLSYPDCRPDYYTFLQQALRAGGTIHNLRINVPFNEMRKHDLIRRGSLLFVDFSLTHTCYTGENPACGKCDSCIERMLSFEAANVEDPILYKTVQPYYQSKIRQEAISSEIFVVNPEYCFFV